MGREVELLLVVERLTDWMVSCFWNLEGWREGWVLMTGSWKSESWSSRGFGVGTSFLLDSKVWRMFVEDFTCLVVD